jgi:NitT/TauT family transport system substrate-binding protein
MNARNGSTPSAGRGGSAAYLCKVLYAIVALFVLTAAASPASAQEQVKIGIGYGLAFLPDYICQDLRLVEKYARALHLDVKASYERFQGVGPMQDSLASGRIDMAPFGAVPLLLAWEKTKNTPRQIVAVSGIATLPVVLLSNRPDLHSIADLRAADRIAMPTLTAPQAYFLQMQSQRTFGKYDRLRSQVVVLSPADALSALLGGTGTVTADFSSPPYTEIALKDENIHPILRSEDVIGGKASFLVMGAMSAYVGSHPKIPEVIDKAMDEAARIIRDDPRRAAQIYLAHEPSKALDAAEVDAVLRGNKDEFGSAVEGIQAFADFLSWRGALKTPPKSWREIVAPALLNSPST